MEGAEGKLEVGDFGRLGARLAVVGPGKVQIPDDDLIDHRAGACRRPGHPFGDQPVVDGPGGGGPVAAQIMVPAVDRDDGLAGGFVEAVGGDAGKTRHG